MNVIIKLSPAEVAQLAAPTKRTESELGTAA